MTKLEILDRLTIAINTLDAISVSGRQNRNYLTGSINLLEEIGSALNAVEFQDAPKETAEPNK